MDPPLYLFEGHGLGLRRWRRHRLPPIPGCDWPHQCVKNMDTWGNLWWDLWCSCLEDVCNENLKIFEVCCGLCIQFSLGVPYGGNVSCSWSDAHRWQVAGQLQGYVLIWTEDVREMWYPKVWAIGLGWQLQKNVVLLVLLLINHIITIIYIIWPLGCFSKSG